MDDLVVKFYQNANDDLVQFVVIACKYKGKWVYVKHKERNTYEIPGGHREYGETVEQAARRELEEETGAMEYTIKPVSYYSVTGKTRVNENGEECYGMLYYAHLDKLGIIHSEIERLELYDGLPDRMTYPLIQPKLIQFIENVAAPEIPEA